MSYHTARRPCSSHFVQKPPDPLCGMGAVCMWYVPAQQCAHPCTVTPTCNCYAGYTQPRNAVALWDALTLAHALQGR